MQTERFGYENTAEPSSRPLGRSMMRGFAGSCPNCGEGRIFSKGLAVNEHCATCEEELFHHRADDLPAYLNIFIIGHIVVALAVILMDMTALGTWSIVGISCVLAVIMAFTLMRPLKGLVVGAQWALRMHGFGGHDD